MPHIATAMAAAIQSIPGALADQVEQAVAREHGQEDSRAKSEHSQHDGDGEDRQQGSDEPQQPCHDAQMRALGAADGIGNGRGGLAPLVFLVDDGDFSGIRGGCLRERLERDCSSQSRP